MTLLQKLAQWWKEMWHIHEWIDDGEGYILFDGYGTRVGEQAKILSYLRKCTKCRKSMFYLLYGCGNGRKARTWYVNKYPPLRKLIK